MIKEINFRGLSALPSGYDSPDGDLALSINAINEDGNLKPCIGPKRSYHLEEGRSLLGIHRINQGKEIHHILKDNNSGLLYYRNLNSGLVSSIETMNDSTVIDIAVIGNMIVLSRQDSMEYLLWKTDENSYQSLGSHIPELDFKIALDAEFTYKKQYYIGKTLTFIKAADAVFDSDSSDSTTGVLKSEVLAAGTIVYKDGYQIPNFSLEKGKSYQFNLEYSGPFMTWYLYYGTSSNRLGIACNGTYGASKSFVAEYDGPVYLGIFYNFSQGETVPDDWTIPYQIAYSFVSGESSGNVDASVLVPANTVENENAIAGVANRFIAEEATAKNRFVSPFFARFAVRLFDGSYASVSQPVLLVPNSASVPFILLHGHEGEYWADAHAFLASLSVCFTPPDGFSKWESVIDGIEIFVSSPAYLYDQGHKHSDSVYPFRNLSTDCDLPGMFSIARLRKGALFLDGETVKRHSFKDALTRTDSASREDYLPYGVVYAPRNAGEVISDLEDKASFYQVAFIDFKTLVNSSGWFIPRLSEGALTNLATRLCLDDSSINYTNFCAASLHVYNSRLHVFNSSATLPYPAPAFIFTQSPDAFECDAWTRVHVNTDEGKRILTRHISGCMVSGFLLWAYYNNPRAFRLEIVASVADAFWYWDIPLSPHGFLNGAYAIAPEMDSPLSFSVITTNPLASSSNGNYDSPLDKASTIFVTEVNNPFIFKSPLTVSVPCSNVLGIASAAKALSQGQFGQFPLYAFTDQGVWALEPTSIGSYSARQPVTRDVCINPDAITQLDSAVVFPTDRGLMLISGSQTQCISETVNALDCGLGTMAACFPSLVPLVASEIPGILNPEEEPSPLPFLSFIKDCGILFDYTHQRIILYSPASPLAPVFSLKSKQWGMMHHNLASHFPSYPEALAVTAEGDVVDFASGSDTAGNAVILSRPLKLDAPDILKTIGTLVARGNFPKQSVSVLLYGSRDLFNWHPIGSSVTPVLRNIHGTPYKHFAVAILASLEPSESLSGASISFTHRFINRLR